MLVSEIDTPAAVVDLDLLSKNIRRLQEYLDRHGIANRPHIKTHKIPEIARMQLEAGAAGITCQKLGEAEVMVAAGITDIFMPYNIIGSSKHRRLTALARRAMISVTADSDFVVDGLSSAFERESRPLTVLVECDTGAHRCGVQSPGEAAALAARIARSPGLDFGGLMTYPSSPNANAFFRATKQLLAEKGLETLRTSGGGTAPMWHAHEYAEISEHRAGMYIYGDRYTVKSGAIALEDCAFHVLSTVVSRPTPERGVLDAGSKALSSDLLGLEGYGLILEYPSARIYSLSEEHGHVDFSECSERPVVGERVTILANHCCPVTNLFNEIIGVREGRHEVTWPVQARGAVQ